MLNISVECETVGAKTEAAPLSAPAQQKFSFILPHCRQHAIFKFDSWFYFIHTSLGQLYIRGSRFLDFLDFQFPTVCN
jgi:hypothetical protein